MSTNFDSVGKHTKAIGGKSTKMFEKGTRKKYEKQNGYGPSALRNEREGGKGLGDRGTKWERERETKIKHEIEVKLVCCMDKTCFNWCHKNGLGLFSLTHVLYQCFNQVFLTRLSAF